MVNDDELIIQIRDRNEDAFRQLYERHSPGIFSYLCRLTGDEIISQDILQEVFITVWSDGKRFRGESSPKTWIFRIAHHRAVSWIRRQKREVRWDVLEDQKGNAGVPSLEWAAVEDLKKALDQLSAEQRAVVELTFSHAMPQQEIALVLGCPVGTVKSRLNAALRHLAGILTRQGRHSTEI